MTEEELKARLIFFDYIYPSISRRLDEIEKYNDSINHKVSKVIDDIKSINFYFKQYKNKIQRIEQFLIKQGLIKLLGENQ